MTFSRDLYILLEHFTGDHYAPDTRTPGKRREIRGICEHYLKCLADGRTDIETMIFARELAEVILRTSAPQCDPKKRPYALLRAIGLSGHKPTEMDKLAYDVMVASAFGVSEDDAIEEARAAGEINLETYIPGEGKAVMDEQSIKRAIRRASGRK